MRQRGFSMIELLVVVAIIALVISLAAPGLRGAREAGRSAACLSNLRQLGAGWALYAAENGDLAMPLAYMDGTPHSGGEAVYWWGADGSLTGRVNHAIGLLTPFLDDSPRAGGVYDCPSQVWGTYTPQGSTREFTSTYGYNGYYLTPAYTPGWSEQIGHRPWQRLGTIQQPCELLVFADTMMAGSGSVWNNALLDPPMLFQPSGIWVRNPYPTTSFRHGHGATGVRSDGSAAGYAARPDWIVHQRDRIGSIGRENSPAYVPDWRRWTPR